MASATSAADAPRFAWSVSSRHRRHPALRPHEGLLRCPQGNAERPPESPSLPSHASSWCSQCYDPRHGPLQSPSKLVLLKTLDNNIVTSASIEIASKRPINVSMLLSAALPALLPRPPLVTGCFASRLWHPFEVHRAELQLRLLGDAGRSRRMAGSCRVTFAVKIAQWNGTEHHAGRYAFAQIEREAGSYRAGWRFAPGCLRSDSICRRPSDDLDKRARPRRRTSFSAFAVRVSVEMGVPAGR